MKRYEAGDIATFYFVVVSDEVNRRIQAWTDDKDLLDFYLEFHKCDSFTVKKVTKPIQQIIDIINENTNDEIAIGNIIVRDPNKKGSRRRTIQIPVTEMEQSCIRDGTQTFGEFCINYNLIHAAVYYLKDKWLRALDDILLLEVINAVIYNKQGTRISEIELDQLMILFHMFPGMFGA